MTTPHPWAGSPNPWRDWLDRPDVLLHHRHLPPGVHGLTDGVRHVWHDLKLLQVERRFTTQHEREHVDAGHTGCLQGTAEARIMFRAAQYLSPKPWPIIEAMIGAGGDYAIAADDLWLPERGLRARLDRRFLHPAESALIHHHVGEELHP